MNCVFIKVEITEHGITNCYESVIGYGECRFVEDEDEIAHGLQLLAEHYGYGDYQIRECAGLEISSSGRSYSTPSQENETIRGHHHPKTLQFRDLPISPIWLNFGDMFQKVCPIYP